MKRALILYSFLCLWTLALSERVSLPMPTHYVEDRAGIISADDEHRINGLLQELEQKTGVQFIVLTVDTTGDVPIEMYSMELVEQWKLGQGKEDNGFLLTVAYKDRRYRFEAGYGLESFLTDQYCGRVGRQVLAPAMKRGQPSEGIYMSVVTVAQTIAAHDHVELSGIPAGYTGPPRRRSHGTPCCFSALPILLFLFMFFSITGRGSVFWPMWLLMGMQYGSHRNPYNRHQRGFWGYTGGVGGGGFGSGGFGSGGFGGFGGGGGGSFGGGGASGGW